MKKINLLLLFIFAVAQFQSSAAVNPAWEWVKPDSIPYKDHIFCDNYLYTIGNGLKKWDTSGNLIWSKPYMGYELEVSNNHDIVILGTMNTPQLTIGAIQLTNNGGNDIVLIKADTAGNCLSANNYGGAGNDYANQLCIDYNDNMYMLGIINNSYGIIKISSAGIHTWTKNIDHQMASAGHTNYWGHLGYSAYDSTLIISGAFCGTFTINNLSISAGYNPNLFVTNDIFLTKIDTDSNVVFLKNISYGYRDDYDNNSMYIKKSTGEIYLNFTVFTLGGGNCNFIWAVKADGTVTGGLSGACDFIWNNQTKCIFGDGDSLISVGRYFFSNSFYDIENAYTGVLIKSIAYYFPIDRVVYGNGTPYFITDGGHTLRKLGDPSYVPMSVYNISDSSVCSNTAFNTDYIINSGYPPYTISWSPSAGLTNPTALNPGFNLDTTTTYILTITDSHNVTIQDTVTFMVFQTPFDSINVTGNTFFCYGANDSVHLSCNMPGLINQWTASNLGIVANDTTAIWAFPNHTYTLTTTDTTIGCFSKSVINLNPHPNYPAVISDISNTLYGDTIIRCYAYDSLTLRSHYNAYTPASKFTWYKNGVLTDSSTQSVKTNTSGQYVLKITDSICTHADTLEVIYSSPEVTAHASANPVCYKDTILLYAEGATTYTWSNGVTDSIPFVITQTTTYTVIGSTFGCSDTSYISILIYPEYTNFITENICVGGAYTFPGGITIENIQNDIQDTLVLKAGTGCDSTVYTNLYVIKPDTSVSLYDGFLSANGEHVSYQWYNCNTGLAIINETSKNFYPDRSGFYYVQVTDDGCTNKSSCYPFLYNEDDNSHCTVYPNPTVSNIVIDYTSGTDGNFKLYNSLGQVVQDIPLTKNQKKKTVTVNGLSYGMYYYDVRFKNKRNYRGKLIVQAQ